MAQFWAKFQVPGYVIPPTKPAESAETPTELRLDRQIALIASQLPGYANMQPYQQTGAWDWAKGLIAARIGMPNLQVGGGAYQYKPFNPEEVPLPAGVTAPVSPKQLPANLQNVIPDAEKIYDKLNDWEKTQFTQYLTDVKLAQDEGADIKKIVPWETFLKQARQEALSGNKALLDQGNDQWKNLPTWLQDFGQWMIQYSNPDMAAKIKADMGTANALAGGISQVSKGAGQMQSGFSSITSVFTGFGKQIESMGNDVKSILTQTINAAQSIGKLLLTAPTPASSLQSTLTQQQMLAYLQSGLASNSAWIQRLMPSASPQMVTLQSQALTMLQSGVTSNAQNISASFLGPGQAMQSGMLQQAQTMLLTDIDAQMKNQSAADYQKSVMTWLSQLSATATSVWNDMKTGFGAVSALLGSIMSILSIQTAISATNTIMGGISSMLNGATSMMGGLGNIGSLLQPLLGGGLSSITNLLGLGAVAAPALPAAVAASPLLLSTLLGTALPLAAPALGAGYSQVHSQRHFQKLRWGWH